MQYLLWVIFLVGMWNGANLIGRILEHKYTDKFLYHIAIGVWAGVIFWQSN